MKDKLNLHTKHTVLPLLGLVILLLLSPCKVRNFIQVELGLTQTEVSNKSQATVSYLDCNDFEITNTSFQKSTSSVDFTAIILDVNTAFVVSDISKSYLQPDQKGNYSVSKIPLYILYQNFKDYL
ncbi:MULTISPECIES: hypothetical protein [unclassified Olleya]|uniref:hypothetical protein n=1 Tax=unclassified Olleya TaxID=2615019 RepID=UPI0011A9A8F2|nr:hypothetical protein [Olleya sp. Hel_I_94]TVZ47391.1 hypothetical protein JM82_1997 [Olleya sp. Hel_I_94]